MTTTKPDSLSDGEGGHTPGPWKIGRYGDVCHGDGEWTGVPFVYGIAEGQTNHADPEVIANTRLIASAPDLLEALKETWRVLDAAGLLNLSNGVQLGQTSWYVKANDAREQSRAAIAKAEAASPNLEGK
jgi:hypothetical protein